MLKCTGTKNTGIILSMEQLNQIFKEGEKNGRNFNQFR